MADYEISFTQQSTEYTISFYAAARGPAGADGGGGGSSNGTEIFATGADTAAGVPLLNGQLAFQIDEGLLLHAYDTGAGDWSSQFKFDTITARIITASSGLDIPDDALSIAKVADLQNSLDGKANLAGGNSLNGSQLITIDSTMGGLTIDATNLVYAGRPLSITGPFGLQYFYINGNGDATALGNVTGGNLSGMNSGDNSPNSLYSGLVSNATHTGDATGATALTLATVNANVGTFGDSTHYATFTVNAKGLITAASQTVWPTFNQNTTGSAGSVAASSITGTTLASNVVTSSLTTVGMIGAGVWQGTVVAGQYGGTGVANTGKTITLGGNLTTSGAFATTLTATATTSVTLPTTGTLSTLAGTETLTNKSIDLASNTLTFTSAQLRTACSDETGTGLIYFQGGDAGTPSAIVLTNASGTASGLTAGNATLAASATILANTRTIGGSNFNGSANVTSFPVPGAIGGTTPNTGAFTTVSTTGALTVGGVLFAGNDVRLAGAAGIAFAGDSQGLLNTSAADKFQFSSNSRTGPITIQGGGSTSSFSSLYFNGTSITARLADGNSGGSFVFTGDVQFTKTIIAPGTTGAQTINKTLGIVNFAAAASTLVVTNSLASTTSIVSVQVEGTDATATSCRITRGSGSFTITLNAPATAETAVSFRVFN